MGPIEHANRAFVERLRSRRVAQGQGVVGEPEDQQARVGIVRTARRFTDRERTLEQRPCLDRLARTLQTIGIGVQRARLLHLAAMRLAAGRQASFEHPDIVDNRGEGKHADG